MIKCEKCGFELNEMERADCPMCHELLSNESGISDGATMARVLATNSQQSVVSDGASGFLFLSGFLMAVVGIILAYFLFSNAKSGWNGLDNRMIIGGVIVLVYQGIVSGLCFKVANLADRVAKLE